MWPILPEKSKASESYSILQPDRRTSAHLARNISKYSSSSYSILALPHS